MEKSYYIKNMVCDRCIKVVKDALVENNIAIKSVVLGEIVIAIENDEGVAQKLEEILAHHGFSLLVNPELQLVEKVKTELIKLLQKLPMNLEEKVSSYLANQLHQDYSKISKVFSYTEKITIEKYFIKLKIEKVKELIQNGELNFTEISQLLDYSNVNHLSTQFKNDTGMNLTDYKSMNQNFRNSLDQIM